MGTYSNSSGFPNMVKSTKFLNSHPVNPKPCLAPRRFTAYRVASMLLLGCPDPVGSEEDLGRASGSLGLGMRV